MKLKMSLKTGTDKVIPFPLKSVSQKLWNSAEFRQLFALYEYSLIYITTTFWSVLLSPTNLTLRNELYTICWFDGLFTLKVTNKW